MTIVVCRVANQRKLVLRDFFRPAPKPVKSPWERGYNHRTAFLVKPYQYGSKTETQKS